MNDDRETESRRKGGKGRKGRWIAKKKRRWWIHIEYKVKERNMRKRNKRNKKEKRTKREREERVQDEGKGLMEEDGRKNKVIRKDKGDSLEENHGRGREEEM